MYVRKNKYSKYKKLIRITKENHNFLKEKKRTKTMAGFLDIIINKYKK